jgi:hypothetical protein
MLQVFLQCGAIHKNIIHEDQDELTQELTEDSVHDMLECSWGVCLPKWHRKELIQTLMCFECHFVLISSCHVDLMISRS